MILHFLDSSVLVKLFLYEAGTKETIAFMSATENRHRLIAGIAPIEVRSAICRLRRMNALSRDEAATAMDQAERELRLMVVQPVTSALLEEAEAFVDRFDLRTLDAIQLASAVAARFLMQANSIQVQEIRFVCSDLHLSAAAASLGFETWNPAG